ncbi:carbonic anhydrase [Candidatus Magnetomorum sp. HK-1]|nr:carbonic anhydrase [Candidatus Magnetomorum sp. HK-1]
MKKTLSCLVCIMFLLSAGCSVGKFFNCSKSSCPIMKKCLKKSDSDRSCPMMKKFAHKKAKPKPCPEKAIAMLKAGNARFISGKAMHPHTDHKSLLLAGSADQGNYAYATVITCSDSRVPVERIFDAGVMDIFVIRVAGNVCDVDEIGSIEYGLAHVRTPAMIVLGHTKCGAVTAVTHAFHGKSHKLERNIPPLIDNIEPAVKRAASKYSNLHGNNLIPHAIVENVWQSIEDLFMNSPVTRDLVKNGKVKVIGAIYNVATGKVDWMPETDVTQILKQVEKNPKRATNPYASSEKSDAHAH